MQRTEKITQLALSVLLALSLAAMPVAAFADEEEEGEAETEAASAETTQQVLHATAGQTLHSNDAAFSATAEGTCGMIADNGAAVIANLLTVATLGNQSAAVSTGPDGGSVSIANSQLSTAGAASPLLFSAGTVEADNVTGEAAKSAIARITGSGAVLLASSHLSSALAGSKSDDLLGSAVALYRTEDIDATSSKGRASLFQASGSTLKSALASGSFFYLTNTTAQVLLSDNDIEFDSSKAKLLVAEGSDTTSNLVTGTTGNAASSYGTPGKNGATVTFTARDQKLEGDVEADSISSIDFFLLDGSKWTGSADISSNSSGADLASNLVVNIDATSGWTVTENSTVSSLNIEKGGALVDKAGKAVTIVDADGNKLVDGASDVKVSVVDEFSTSVKTADANIPRSATIDRTAFDEEFGTSTAFGTNGSDAVASDEERVAALQAIIVEWFHNL